MARPAAHIALALLVSLSAATEATADVFRPLDDPREAMQARVDIIQQAERQVHALYFLARGDRVTFSALALLREARRRGVPSVRLIVDANFSHIPKAVLAHLREEGVEVRVYHPITLRHPSWLFRRMHEKVVVVDGERYITGGRNLAEAYFGLAKKKNYVDRDVYVEGASAAAADRHFESLWASPDVADLDVHVMREQKRRAAEALSRALHDLAAEGVIVLDSGTDWSAVEQEVGNVRFFHDPVSPGTSPRVSERFAGILGSAEHSIVIESPYLVPSKSMLALLETKAANGVKVTVLTNSLRSCDGVLPQAGYLRYRRRLVRAGIDLREYRGPDALHAKTAVIDGRTVVIGSYNIDPRSENLNTEVLCVTEDRKTACDVLASVDSHLAHAWTVGARSERPAKVSRAVSVRAWLARLVVPLIEGQL